MKAVVLGKTDHGSVIKWIQRLRTSDSRPPLPALQPHPIHSGSVIGIFPPQGEK